MSLTDIGPTIATETGVTTRARSHTEEIVLVRTTQEAIADHGWGAIWPIAENKYSDGDLYDLGPPPIILVISTDCSNWLTDHQ